jgi:uncharacterized protein YigA (DUF484 family)
MKHDDIAQFLAQHPEFFEQHPELLAGLNVPHPQNGHAISLVERQSIILRNRITALEARIAEMARHGEENDVIADKLVHWTRALLLQADPAQLPETLLRELLSAFTVPHGALRLWDVQPQFAELACAQPVSEDVKRLASSMVAPFCGSNVGFEAAEWMQADTGARDGAVQSLAMLPLRVGAKPAAFGLLVLGSPDKDRFHISMGTAFLTRIAELASAALARLAAVERA